MKNLGAQCLLIVATAAVVQSPRMTSAQAALHWSDPWIHVACWVMGFNCTPEPIKDPPAPTPVCDIYGPCQSSVRR